MPRWLNGRKRLIWNVLRKAEDRARERLNRKDADLDVARAELALKRALARQDILA